jgi:hypothetical protein
VDPDCHALGEELAGDGDLPPLGHAGYALRPDAAKHEHAVPGDRQVLVVDPGEHVVHPVEDHRRAPVLEQRGVRGLDLDQSTSGRELPAWRRIRPACPHSTSPPAVSSERLGDPGAVKGRPADKRWMRSPDT